MQTEITEVIEVITPGGLRSSSGNEGGFTAATDAISYQPTSEV